MLALSLSVRATDIIIYGGTPGGTASANAVARMGSEVTLVEHYDHIGGMTTSGLGKSDNENREKIDDRWLVAPEHLCPYPRKS